jgi:hypothetical protein
MTQKMFRALALLPCAAVMLGGLGLHADTSSVKKFEVPFSFHVQHQSKVMPAGEYVMQTTPGSPITVITNTKTGERARFLNPAGFESNGDAKVVFEPTEEGTSLKRIS